MVRWLLVGLLVLGLGVGLRNGWLEVHWDRMNKDLGVPFLNKQDPLQELSK
ncbi:MAG: 4-hydroxythreonine-4-phosphate dehydrogenase [Synechococcaceae cyanobacterium]|nr:4-hydroxythreonine-4-phosphate dehydrogenase [Synechococcaceae cyanobacterium]